MKQIKLKDEILKIETCIECPCHCSDCYECQITCDETPLTPIDALKSCPLEDYKE